MRKTLKIWILIVIVISACQRKHTCECEAIIGANSQNMYYTFEGTVSEANEQCENHEKNQKPSYQFSGGNYNCQLQ